MAVLTAAAMMIGAGFCGSAEAQTPSPTCRLEAGPQRAVAAILDGETIRLDDGKDVRLIGALAPRSTDAAAEIDGPWLPEEKAVTAVRRLLRGRSVTLSFAGRRADRYGRVLAHVHVTRSDGTRVWVQQWLIEQGMARAYSLPDSDDCMAELLAAEASARRARHGLWDHAAYQVRPADRPAELARYRTTFQVVSGTVIRAFTSASRIYLTLKNSEPPAIPGSRSRRGAFRVVWVRSLQPAPGVDKPDALVGRDILVRGWIEQRNGPQINIEARGQIELATQENTGNSAISSGTASNENARQ
jgi:endonuclease YncB( thermonuclease family)